MSLATLLLVEDDFLTRAALSDLLVAHHYEVDLATDGAMAIAMTQATAYDLVLLDLQIPKLDGIGVCQHLRSHHYVNPILLLTARTSNADIVAGLDAGADDYVTKPYEPEALLARIRALLRRQVALSAGAPSSGTIVRWGDLCLDLDAGRVTFADQAIALTATEFNLLELFLRNPDRIFSRAVILDRLWGLDKAPTERAIVTHVKDLRKKLKAGGLGEEIIETVYGMGYRLKPAPVALSTPQRASLPEPSSLEQPLEHPFGHPPDASPAHSPQHDAVQRVIERFRYSFNVQVDVLARASAAIAAQQIDQALYDEAKQEAHKLAGSMATFGYPNGSRLSRSIEHLLLKGIPTAPADIARLSELVSALQQELPPPQSTPPTLPPGPPLPEPPLPEPPLPEPPLPESLTAQSAEGAPSVLLVSRDPELSQSLREGLCSLGLALAIASDVNLAQSQFAAAQPAVVIVDLAESGDDQDGLRLLQDLSQRSPSLPAIVVAQADSFALRLVASRLGARQFLPKQAPVEQMVRAIARVLPPPRVSTARVLIVDDDAASRAYLSALLVPWGLEVVTLDEPQRFWQVLTATRPHLVILDLEMPQISGLELCQVVRQDAQWGDLPLLVVTAHTDTDALQQAFAAGADDFISKPVLGPELVTRVLSRIERTRSPIAERPPAMEGLEVTADIASQGAESAVIYTAPTHSEVERSEIERRQVQDQLQQTVEQQRIVMDMTQRIRRSLHLDDILQTTANEVRQVLQTDRVIIFQFDPSWAGTVVVESCGDHCLPILATEIVDPCFAESYVQPFREGLVTAKADIHNAGIDPCHLNLLSQFQVRANLVVPVLKDSELWGLLIAHHCVAPRDWQPSEIDLLRQIAAQVSIAIQQSNLYAQVQTELLERQQIEAALRQSEQRYRSLVTASAQIVWLTDANGRATTTPHGWLEILGQTLEEYQGWGWLDAVHPDDRDRTSQTWRAAYTTRTRYETEYRLRLKDGSYHHFAVRGVPIVDETGEIVEWIGTCTDITERKQAEEALRQAKAELESRVDERTAELMEVNNRLLNALVYRQEIETALRQSEEKFRQLAENIQAVFWIVEYATRQVLYVSPAYATLWHRNPDSLYIDPLDWLEAVHPDDRPRLQSSANAIAQASQYDTIYRIIQSDGGIRWIRDRAFPIKNEVGAIVRIAGIAEDITEQQKLEQIKNEFISIVSHELRTPLASIQLSLGLLKAGIYDNNPSKFKRMLEIALIDTQRLVSLVNDILDLERLEAGRAILEKGYCQAADLMQEAASGLQTLASQSQVILMIEPTDVELYASAEAIVQTLTNLLSNAIKFSPPHAIVTLQVEERDRDILFTVRDQGRGIPADKLKTIFGRFQQVDASDAREKGGTGLGLAICQSIVEQHSGQIWVESTLGEGSTFFVSLPRPAAM